MINLQLHFGTMTLLYTSVSCCKLCLTKKFSDIETSEISSNRRSQGGPESSIRFPFLRSGQPVPILCLFVSCFVDNRIQSSTHSNKVNLCGLTFDQSRRSIWQKIKQFIYGTTAFSYADLLQQFRRRFVNTRPVEIFEDPLSENIGIELPLGQIL